jgi:hypothetical protein
MLVKVKYVFHLFSLKNFHLATILNKTDLVFEQWHGLQDIFITEIYSS